MEPEKVAVEEKTKKITIGGREYTLKKFSLKDRAVVNSAIVYEMNPETGNMTTRFTERYYTLMLLRGIIEPKLTETQIEAMPDEEGSALVGAIMEFNSRPLLTRAPLLPPTSLEG